MENSFEFESGEPTKSKSYRAGMKVFVRIYMNIWLIILGTYYFLSKLVKFQGNLEAVCKIQNINVHINSSFRTVLTNGYTKYIIKYIFFSRYS